MKLDQCCISEYTPTIYRGLEEAYQIKSLYATDPNFLDNVLLEYEKLPKHIQEFIYSNLLEEPNPPGELNPQDSNSKTIFQKIKQFLRSN